MITVRVRPEVPDAADDAALLVRLRRGERSAFVELVGRYHRPMRRLARRFVSTDASAEEIVQDTWCAVIRSLDAFEARSSLRTWITRILVNRARTTGAREARTIPFSDLHGDDDRRAPPGIPGDPDRQLDRRHVLGILDEELRRLPERQRRVIVLRDTLDWTAAEVRDALSLSETNQRVLLHRGRATLRARVKARLAAAEAPGAPQGTSTVPRLTWKGPAPSSRSALRE